MDILKSENAKYVIDEIEHTFIYMKENSYAVIYCCVYLFIYY